jgi:hypothetical protein
MSGLGQKQHPFLGVIDAVIVDEIEGFAGAGSISREHADAAWLWLARDVGPELLPGARDGYLTLPVFENALPMVLTRARQQFDAAADDFELQRRLFAQMGSERAVERIPLILDALRSRALIEKAADFGRAVNAITDDAALSMALQSMPVQDATQTALLMQAAIGHVAQPMRLMAAAVKIAGAGDETAIARLGFAPLVEAILSHAGNQIPAMNQWGAFADIDLCCRAVERFHRLMRAVMGFIELHRLSRWSEASALLVRAASAQLETRLNHVGPDVAQALRRRDNSDRIDADGLLTALNGVYLLATIRDSRDSLALNALFDQTWSQVGQQLEMHLDRIVEHLRANPSSKSSLARLEAGIKMAELRFNAEYADVLRRSRDGIVRGRGYTH